MSFFQHSQKVFLLMVGLFSILSSSAFASLWPTQNPTTLRIKIQQDTVKDWGDRHSRNKARSKRKPTVRLQLPETAIPPHSSQTE